MGLLDALRDPQFRRDVKTNARNLGQSASNTIASNISAPVDLIALALRKAGIPVPEPVGGSQWMTEQGLTRDVPQGAPKLAGETLGFLAPLAGTKEGAAAIARGLNQMAANAAVPRAMNPQTGAIVWHGSPHKFDKFDSSKIGTGEGAQAYGHGLYLAESPDVAREYQKRLSDAGSDFTFKWNGRSIPAKSGPESHAISLAYHDSPATAKRVAKDGLAAVKANEPWALEMGGKDYWQKMLDTASTIKSKKEISGVQGSLYKVDLPDEQIARMLDWDKPLSQQAPNIKDALAKLKKSNPSGYDTLVESQLGGPLMEQAIGRDLYKAIGHDAFPTAGIPGIRYLDGGSRGAGQGSSNFVVFPGNEDILRILERNGQVLP